MMIEEMAKRAAQVASEHEALEEAKRDKGRAQVDFLRAVVRAAKPALPALCSRLANSPARALNVAHGLYLGESGTWIESRDGGTYLIARPDADVARDYVVEDIADAISAALSRHVGKRAWGTEEIGREAERLRAAVLLLRGPS